MIREIFEAGRGQGRGEGVRCRGIGNANLLRKPPPVLLKFQLLRWVVVTLSIVEFGGQPYETSSAGNHPTKAYTM